MIFAETERLVLRALSKDELPRFVILLDVWEVVRWMSVIPYPYTLRDAEFFYNDMQQGYWNDDPQFFALALKDTNLLIGGLGLHPPRAANAPEGEMEIGYWLGIDYWGQGYASEALREGLVLGFGNPLTQTICATTAINNMPSQNVLRKAGFINQGPVPRDAPALRGDDTVLRWVMPRDIYKPAALS